MPSGAGHDAQMLARVCPAGMVFVPSVGGVSHNPAERTAPADLEAGANVLLDVLVDLAGGLVADHDPPGAAARQEDP
jgi:N-carbamoyl-L-amino-acid hydrolase